MMNDVRDHVAPVETTGKTEKIVAALIVALGFVAVGVFAYETGGRGIPQPKVAAVHEQAPPPAPLADATTSVTPPQSTAELPPLPDLPAAAPAVKDSAPKAAAAKTASQPAPTPSVRVARAPSPAPQAPAAPPPVVAEAAPAVAPPVVNIPEPAAPQESPAPVSAPAQEAPAPDVAAPPDSAPPQ